MLRLKKVASQRIELNVTDFDCPVQCRDRLMSLRGRVFVREIARKSKIHNGLSDKSIVQFLAIIDVMTTGIATRMEMPDPLEVVTDVANDVSIHNLRVINVVQDFHTR